MESRNATVFFAETKHTSKEELFASVETFRGKHVKTIGTAHLFLFDDPQAACEAALKLKRGQPAIPFRVGIARGPVSLAQGDAFGDVVNLAARLQGIAKSQEVYVSEEVREAVDRFLIPLKAIGSRQFTGLNNPVSVFSLETSAQAVISTENSASNAADKNPPTEAVFDFSRVDQERMQEEDLIRATIPARVDDSLSISLAREPQEIKGQSRSSRSSQSRSKITNPEVFTQRTSEHKKKALTLFVTLSVAVPVILIGSIWGYYKIIVPSTRPEEIKIDEKLKNSEVIKSLNRPRTERMKLIGQEIKYGTLSVYTDPPGAQVYIDDRLVASETPVNINKVPANRGIQLKVAKSGFEESLQIFILAENEKKKILVKLVRQ